ncbi:MAG TPA: hypothetical protein VER79_12430 [Candidatus Limnocylindrales bacterium]|nr:hypothetical protein [Candidatus Limnocylindrales bacterium]
MFTKPARSVPNLVVARRVLDRMLGAAQAYLEDETGEAMVGLVVPAGQPGAPPTIYILDTIAPDETALRQFHTFQQGDERQDELIWWLQENWRMMREKRGLIGQVLRGKFDVPLRFLGDWHKQPGFMIQPSGGDLMTALDWLDDPDNRSDFLLAPIVTLGHPSTVFEGSTQANYLMMPTGGGEALRVDFWYIDRKTGVFQPIAPAVYPDDQLPLLAPYPWHLMDPKRIKAELALMDKEGLFHSITLYNTDNEPPLEVCFLTARVGADKLFIAVTPHDYPKRPPQIRVAPFMHMRPNEDLYHVFEATWKQSQPVALNLDSSPALYLTDAIRAAEDKLGIVRTPAPAAPAADPPAAAEPPAPNAPAPIQPEKQP